MGELLQRLEDLFKARLAKSKNNEKINFVEDGGKKLYDDALDEILKMIELIEDRFKGRVDGCDLFGHVEDEMWKIAFKENFYKLFVDRDRCKVSKDGAQNYSQYNDTKITWVNSLGADVCYGEAMAVAFLFMLKEIYKKFEKDENSGEISQISSEEFLRVLYGFNAIATVNDDNESKISVASGAPCKYEDALEFKKGFGRFGKIFYNLSHSSIFIVFSESFPHQNIAQDYYEGYLGERSLRPQDSLLLIFELSVLLSSQVHLFKDGNGRATTLMGWFMAIDAKQSFPAAIVPYIIDRKIFDEAQNFTKKFMEDPAINPVQAEALSLKDDVLGSALDGADPALQVLTYFSKKFFDKTMLCAIEQETSDLLFLGNVSHVIDMWVATNDRSDLNAAEEIKVLNVRFLKSAIEENIEAIGAEGDEDKKMFLVAFNFIKKIAQISKDESLSESEKLSPEDLQTFSYIAMYHKITGWDYPEVQGEFSDLFGYLSDLIPQPVNEVPKTAVDVKKVDPVKSPTQTITSDV